MTLFEESLLQPGLTNAFNPSWKVLIIRIWKTTITHLDYNVSSVNARYKNSSLLVNLCLTKDCIPSTPHLTRAFNKDLCTDMGLDPLHNRKKNTNMSVSRRSFDRESIDNR